MITFESPNQTYQTVALPLAFGSYVI